MCYCLTESLCYNTNMITSEYIIYIILASLIRCPLVSGHLFSYVIKLKFFGHSEDAELQRVPGRFESVEEYVRVFEPLLFEECRAQLYSTWEELTETNSNSHTMVRIKNVERRERGTVRCL